MFRNLIPLLSVLSAFLPQSTQAAETKPNVVLIVVDDLGWTDIAPYGSDLHQTPNIDRLAASGMKFTDAYSACTVCSPTRASIMTGQYPARLKITDWITGHKKPFAKMSIPDWQMGLPGEAFTLAEALKEAGYKTAHIGKWHVGHQENLWPEHQGFDINTGGWKAGSPGALGAAGYFSPYNNPRLKDGPKGEYLTERLAQEAASFIDQAADSAKPFFLNFWLYNVHTPLQAREEKIEKFKKLAKESGRHTNPVYAAMVEHMDDAVGVVMAKLKERGLDENTIVIFTSDNGGLIGNYENQRKKVTSNAPLRSGKGDMFEGGVRVPFIASWPGHIPADTVSSELVISPDLYPTILALTGVKGNEEANALVDGENLAPTLLDQKPTGRDSIFWHYPHYHLEGAKPYSAIRKGNWKLIQVYEEEQPQLYNLESDISESHDLAGVNPQKKDELFADLQAWKKKVGAQEPTPNPNYDPAKVETWNRDASATADAKDDQAAAKSGEALPSAGRFPVSSFCKALKTPGTRILEEDGWNVWCASPIYGDDGKVHVLFSRWRGDHSHWLSQSEIAHAVADKPEGPYTVTGTVLKGQGPGHWDADTIHNPTIHKVGDRYALFYIGNNLAEAEKNKAHHASTQRIGLALADKIEGPYTRVGKDGLILDISDDKSKWDSYLTTNPAFFIHPDGEFWLYYKAWDVHNDNLRKMGVATSKNLEGPYTRHPSNPLVSFSHLGKQVEDAYVFQNNGKFYMVMRDMGVIHPHVGLMLESEDGIKWSEPMLGYEKSPFYFPGEEVERFERPQVLFKDGKPTHLFLALMGGKGGPSSAAVLEIDPAWSESSAKK